MSPLANNNSYHSDDDEHDHFVTTSHHSRRRKVHFQPWVDFLTIPHVSDYSKEEIESVWYSPKELRSRKRRSPKKTMTSPVLAHDSHHYDLSEGDVLSTREVNHRRGVVIAALEAVLTEQDAQDNEGVHEAGILADAYVSRTRNSQFEAVERARCQAQDVKLHDLFQW